MLSSLGLFKRAACAFFRLRSCFSSRFDLVRSSSSVLGVTDEESQ